MGCPETRKRKQPTRRATTRVSSHASTISSADTSDSEPSKRPAKRQRVAKENSTAKPWMNHLGAQSAMNHPTTRPPARVHVLAYHCPLLLDDREARLALLTWYDRVSTARLMPWRKPWIDPRTWAGDPQGLRVALERRAYEVWISEIMLQQTRVSVVIEYWKAWMKKWPTIRDLAGAEPEDVLGAWRGLGYYSRATRIHEAAKLVVEDPALRGMLPSDADRLRAVVPGVGRYTAGAISAIVFGEPEAMVDGNVIRVLSRQMGVLADFKTNSGGVGMLWDAADSLAKAVSLDAPDDDDDDDDSDLRTSSRPGRWGQALMELGSTICTPKPDCGRCPVTSTCRAFGEGMLTVNPSEGTGTPPAMPAPPDVEDLCTLCLPLEEILSGEDPKVGQTPKKTQKRAKKVAPAAISSSKPSNGSNGTDPPVPDPIDQCTLDGVVDYARRFPVKSIKKAVRIEESLVCAIRCGDVFLIQKRPSKGLLAGLWELPSFAIPEPGKSTALSRRRMAQSCISDLLSSKGKKGKKGKKEEKAGVKYAGELGSVPWLFSHIKLTMHVHLFELEEPVDGLPLITKSRWATSKDIENESMGTGMRKCWAMVRLSGR